MPDIGFVRHYLECHLCGGLPVMLLHVPCGQFLHVINFSNSMSVYEKLRFGSASQSSGRSP